ncbi:hypothetical protein Dtox_0903 [Desulfofarcimen acetoxidans DSM 771]|uniref:Uncharacterized protein n=1 Tax=Desulfofarcimen acetoxidans (strain ATCC 49208 / DSM 771 / KCTC 5769 / VKM B-1644 / 5575) TaxID=485916 RepID=C8W330_DESAS|nr:hypothetical protein [Desulfofarcimen acetoxidans]ACV61797.1 hypothetical protein Dtox_0903 [Desulfofarcimen acetoxidans DSM 771]
MKKRTKIRKNLTDQDMLASFLINNKGERITCLFDEEEAEPSAQPVKRASTKEESSFLTPELQEKVDKALLELKVKLFKDGIIDYEIKVSLQANQVVLAAVPLSEKKKIKR